VPLREKLADLAKIACHLSTRHELSNCGTLLSDSGAADVKACYPNAKPEEKGDSRPDNSAQIREN